MIINVPFKFQVDGLRKGRQRNASYEVWELAELDIPVVSVDDAPVAVSWDDRFPELLRPDQYAPAEWGCHSADGSAHTVYHDNSHWVALNASDNAWASAPGPYGPFLFDELVRKLAADGECPVLGSHGYDTKAKRQVEECGNDAHELFYDVSRSTREHRMRDLAKKASNLIVVEDRVYRRCIEPQFWIMKGIVSTNRTSAGDSNYVAIVRVATDEAAAKTHSCMPFSGRKTFGLGEFDEISGHARSFNEHRRYREQANIINDAARPAITHTMAFDEAAHIRSRVRELWTSLAQEFMPIQLGQMAKSTIRRFLDVDDLLQGIGSEEGLLRFEEAAFQLQADLSNVHNKQHRLSSIAEELVEVLENRDIGIGNTIDPVKRTAP
ncbi:hypothetical protein OIU34_16850 [Pararhizobium sp. BT-229]|uniref:hypothetical protein n=1 Tax=Pararhizobium sp. BT-229 TaxID=2986923 RepID=UPI0021F6A0E2|nr:hypothetical protein [Pararhizobium sp. BT-229]MCV9963574.1 hypothetical protein [Pararhizobium sp. BT-229]